MYLIKVLVVVFLFFGFDGWTQSLTKQDYILKVKSKTGNDRIIENHHRVLIYTLDSTKFKGKINVINDDSLEIRDTVIALSEIKYMRKNPLFKKVLGISAIGGGTLIIPVGVFLINYANQFVGPTKFYLQVGGAFSILGGTTSIIFGSVLLSVPGKKYFNPEPMKIYVKD